MNPRSHIQRSVFITLVAGTVIATTSCGNATESGVERLIEEQSGGSVDVDLDDGGVSIQTEEGAMTVDEDGSFVITDATGDTLTGNVDSGEFNVESGDGGMRSGSTTELPEQWPSEIPEPAGISIENATVIVASGETSISVTGTASDSDVVDSYVTTLEAAGFVQQARFDSDDTIDRVLSNDSWTVGVIGFGNGSARQVTVSVTSIS